MEAGRSFASESPDLQLTLLRAGREAGLAASCTLSPGIAKGSMRPVLVLVGARGRSTLSLRFCSKWTSVRCHINCDFYTVAPWRFPSVDSTVGRLLVPSAQETLNCCQGGRCYPGCFVHFTGSHVALVAFAAMSLPRQSRG